MKKYVALTMLVISGMGLCSAAMAESWQSPLQQEHPLVGRIFDVHSGEDLAEEALLARLVQERYILLGEKHDNADHFTMEQKLLTALLARQRNSRVVFEMLDDSQQAAIEQLAPAAGLAQIKQALQWPSRGWDWQRYGPLFQLTLNAGASLVAGNVRSELLKQVYQTGEAALLPAQRFASLAVLSSAQRRQIQQQVYESHCEMMPLESLAPMVTVQMAKDASMAYAMIQGSSAQTILIAGGFHVSRDVGVPRHLQWLAPEAQSTVLMMMEVEPDIRSLSDYGDELKAIADYVWFSPRATDKDYCAGLRKQHRMQGQP